MLAILNNEVTAQAAEQLSERIKGLQKKFVDYLATLAKQHGIIDVQPVAQEVVENG